MQNYKLFIRSMRVMGKKRFVYLGSIFVMSVTFALFGIMSSLLMKCVVDIAQTGRLSWILPRPGNMRDWGIPS